MNRFFSVLELVKGVTPTDDFLVYEVASSSRRNFKHRVDFCCYSGFGACSCEHFRIRINEELAKGKVPTKEDECDHIKRARRYLAIETAQGAIKRRQDQANANRTSNGHTSSQYKSESPEW